MQNITFRCGHCNNLMAVTPLDVGKQVRCPHCQQVVVAPTPPAPAPVPAPEPEPAPAPAVEAPAFSFEISAPVEHESIFAAPPPSDDLFGDPAPKVELPPAPVLTLEAPPLPQPEPLPPEPVPPATGTEEAEAYPAAIQATAADEVFQQPSAAPWETSTTPVDDSSLVASEPSAPIVRRHKASSGWYIPLLMVPLVSYAVLATILLLIVYKQNQRLLYERPHPLENVPDMEGDVPGVTKPGSRTQVEYPDPDQALPAHLKTKLGQKITVGALEFEPLKVTKEHIFVESKGSQAEQEKSPCMVLHFKVTNVSSDQSFAPTDAYFYRLVENASLDDVEPYTRLEIGEYKLIGGPAHYAPRGSKRLRETVRDQVVNKVLGPGESLTTFVCTDPRKGNLNRMLAQHKGELLWRVQLRRGLVAFESPYKGQRSVPACVVLGVSFAHGDIQAKN